MLSIPSLGCRERVARSETLRRGWVRVLWVLEPRIKISIAKARSFESQVHQWFSHSPVTFKFVEGVPAREKILLLSAPKAQNAFKITFIRFRLFPKSRIGSIRITPGRATKTLIESTTISGIGYCQVWAVWNTCEMSHKCLKVTRRVKIQSTTPVVTWVVRARFLTRPHASPSGVSLGHTIPDWVNFY